MLNLPKQQFELHQQGREARTIRADRLRLIALVIIGWLLVAFAWTVPTYWVEQVQHPPGAAAPGPGHVLVQMIAMYTPWALLTPLIWNLGRKYPFGRKFGRATVVHLLSGTILVPLMVLTGDLVASLVFRVVGEPFTFTMRGVLLTSFYCIPTFVALVAVGQSWSKASQANVNVGSFRGSSAGGSRIPLARLTVRERGRTDIVNVVDIDFIDMAGHYLCLHVGPQVHLLRGTMREIEDRLDPEQFIRVHRSTMVQLDRITAISERKNGDCVLLLKSGAEIAASRSYRGRLAERLGLNDGLTQDTVQDNDLPVRAKA